jgi:hypothetical protein
MYELIGNISKSKLLNIIYEDEEERKKKDLKNIFKIKVK